MSPTSMYVTGGTLAPESPSYVVRAADAELLDLCDRGEFAFVLTSRQMGKSSLMARTMSILRERDILVAAIDLNEIGSQGVTPDQWYAGLLTEIEGVCHEDTDLFAWWARNAGLSHAQRFLLYLGQVLLPRLSKQLVVLIDEIDSTIRLDFTDDFFAAVRTAHNSRALDPQFEKISFVLLGVATPAELIRDQSRTPFNIGTKVELSDFGRDEALPLVESLGHDEQATQSILDAILRWTGGQPYLVQRVCAALDALPALQARDIDALVRDELLSEHGRSDPHYQFVSQYLLATPPELHDELFATYADVLRGRAVPCRDASAVHNRLRLAGVVRRADARLVMRNEVYRQLFGQEWVRKNRKKHWIVVNRRLLTALSASTAGALMFAWIALEAWRAQERALENERAAQASELAAAAQSELMQGDMGLGLLLAKYALRTKADSPSAHSSALVAADVGEGTILLGTPGANWRMAALSSDGRRVATADTGKAVHEWDAETGALLASHYGLEEVPSALAYSRDGGWLFAGGADGAAMLWNLNQSGAPVRAPRHPSRIVSAVFSPGSDYLVTSDADGHLAVIDVKSAQLLKVIDAHAGPVHYVSIADSGKLLCAGVSDGRVHCWKGRPLTFDRSIRAHVRPVNGAALDAGGETLVTAAWNEGTRLWRTIDGRQVANLTERGEVVYATALSPDGSITVTGDDVGKLRVWNMATGRLENVVLAHNGPIWRISFSANGRRIITAGEDELSKVWDAASVRLLAQGPLRDGPVRMAALSPDGRKALTLNSSGTAAVWSVDRNLLLAELSEAKDRASAVRFDPAGNLLVVHDMKRLSLRRNDAAHRSLQSSLSLDQPLIAHAWEPGHEGMLVLDAAGAVVRWDGKSAATPVTQIRLGEAKLRRAEFSPDAKRVVVIDERGGAALFDVSSGALLGKLSRGGRTVAGAEFDPAGKSIATFGPDKAIDLWDGRTGTFTKTIEVKSNGVQHVAIAADAARLLAVESGRAAVYDLRKAELAYELDAMVPPSGATPFSQNGSRLMLAAPDRATWIYDAASGRPIASLRAHKGSITSARLSYSGHRAITASDDAKVYVWDARSGARLIELRGHASGVVDARFSPDGRQAVTLDDLGTVRLWDITRAQLSPSELADWIDRRITNLGRVISPAECLTYFPQTKAVRPPECSEPVPSTRPIPEVANARLD